MGNNGVPNQITVNNGATLDINGHGNWTCSLRAPVSRQHPEPANHHLRHGAGGTGALVNNSTDRGLESGDRRSPGRQRERRRGRHHAIGEPITDSGSGYTLTRSARPCATLTSGGNTYTGGTIVSGGTLQLAAATASAQRPAAFGQRGRDGHQRAQPDGSARVTLASGAIVNNGGAATITATSYSVSSGTISANLNGGAWADQGRQPDLVVAQRHQQLPGDTTINGGTLAVNGSLYGSGHVDV